MKDGQAVTRIGGHPVEFHAAGEVEVGWTLLLGGEVVRVTGIKFGPPKEGEIDRQVWIWVSGTNQPRTGDEGQTVYRVVDEPVVAAQPELDRDPLRPHK